MAEHVPAHVAVIMDGNGRWAKKRLLPRSAGHRAGMNNMLALSEHAFDRGIKYLTLYCLSQENLKRSEEELEGLYALFREYFLKNTKTLCEKGISLRVIGDLALLPEDVKEVIETGVAAAAGGERGTLTLAIGYGGRQDIVRAANLAVRAGKEVTEEEFSSLLATGGLPAPDLLIRTGKEVRISNFLLFECAYAEFYFTDVLFPDFGEKELDRALAAYAARDRRFGRT